MNPKYVEYLTWLVGAVSVGISLYLDNSHTQFIKPFFHVGLYLFYFLTAKKNNGLLAGFLLAGMFAEFFTARDFEHYYAVINILFAVYFSVGIWFLLPVLKKTTFNLKRKYVLLTVLFVSMLLYIIYALVYFSIEEFKEKVPAALGGITFVGFVGSCFYITLFHQHPKKFNLFIVGVCYFVVCTGYLIYELLLPSNLLMALVNLAEVIAQFFFIHFIIDRKEMLKNKIWLI